MVPLSCILGCELHTGGNSVGLTGWNNLNNTCRIVGIDSLT
jgi:hypothetical protein